MLSILVTGIKINGKPAYTKRRILNEPSDESLHEMILGCHMSHTVMFVAECEDEKEVTINWDLGDANTIVSESYFNDHPTRKYSRVQREIELTLPTGEAVNLSMIFGNRTTPEFISVAEWSKAELRKTLRKHELSPALSNGGEDNGR